MNYKKRILKKIDRLATKLECFDRHDYGMKGFLSYMMSDRKSNNLTIFRFNDETILRNPAKYYFGNKVAIVFQGPVVHEDNFTVDSIRMVRNIYPDICIILSTWKHGLLDDEKHVLEEVKCIIIENEEWGDEFKGNGEKTGHLNNQLLSARGGIRYLLNNTEVEYALKIRTDLRLYKPNFIQYLLDVLKMYNGKERLISVAFSNSLPGVPFHLSDFVWFGKTELLYQLYSIPLRTEDELKYIVSYVNNTEEYLKYREQISKIMDKEFSDIKEDIKKINLKFMLLYHEESYIVYRYALSRGYASDDILDQYPDFLAREVIVLDDNYLMALWKKSLYSALQTDYSIKMENRFSHAKWLHLYLKEKAFGE